MKKITAIPMRYLLLLLPLLVATACNGQKKPAANVGTVAKDGNSLLWRISKKGMNDSYLFGTIHMICKDDYLWTPTMEAALADAEKVCLEIDLDDPSMMGDAMAGLMGAMGGDDDGKVSKSTKELLTPEQYKRYKSFLRDTLEMDGMMLAAAEMMGPTMVEMMALTKLVDCGQPESYEQNIMTIAAKDKKEIVGLETAKEQMELLTGIEGDTTADGIMKMVDSFEVMRQGFRDMVKVYKEQDLGKLSKLMVDQKEMGDMKPLLDDRNAKWIGKMEKMMKDNTMFFAVGAGHLSGDKGVIALLRKQGYTLTPLR